MNTTTIILISSYEPTTKSDQDKNEYTQIIYDRLHSLPIEMDLWTTA